MGVGTRRVAAWRRLAAAGALLVAGAGRPWAAAPAPCFQGGQAAAFRTLGLGEAQGAEPDVLKRAYRKAVLRWHPDSPDGDADHFQKVKAAFELLDALNGLNQGGSSTARAPASTFDEFEDLANDLANDFQEDWSQAKVRDEWVEVDPLDTVAREDADGDADEQQRAEPMDLGSLFSGLIATAVIVDAISIIGMNILAPERH